ncbi:PAS-domain containing protein [Minwuia sp. IMCC3060]|uniref:PAS-domain containing protein n=1 Tax=Minwuia sp. IMCC3060 TaxID=3040675 RepID=UPI00247A64A9|nr:PAS-domain containing protein [Minwuia sp. IMCC3060]
MKKLLSSLAVRVTVVFAVMFLAFAGGFLIWYDQFRRDAMESEVAAQVASLGHHLSTALSEARRHEANADVVHLLRLAQGYRSIRCVTVLDTDGGVLVGWPNRGCVERQSRKNVDFTLKPDGVLRIDYGGSWITETLREERLFVLAALGVSLAGALLSALLANYVIVQRRLRSVLDVTGGTNPDLTRLRRIAAKPDEIGQISSAFLDRIEAERVAAEREQAARLEDQRSERDRLMSSIFDALSEGLLTHDLNLRIVGCNKAVCEQFGYTEEEFLRLHVRDLMPADQYAIYEKVFQAYLAGAVDLPGRQTTLTAVHKSGRRLMGDISFSETRLDGERLFTGVLTDRTKEREAQETARMLQERLLAAIETVPDGFVLFDAEDRLVICNQKYREIYGNAPEMMEPGTRFEDGLRAGVERGEYLAAVGREEEWIADRMHAHRNPPEDPIEKQLASGRWIRITERRTPEGGIVGFRTDITEIKQRELELQIAQTRLVSAIEAVPDAFVLYDADDRLVICNQKYRDFYANSADVMLSGNTFEHIIRTGAERGQYAGSEWRIEEWVAARLALHRNPPEEPLEQQLGDGRWLRIIERRTPDGGTVGFRIDISELKRREFELQESEKRLRATIDVALDCVIVMDAEGKVVTFNPAAETLFGYRAADVVGREMADLIIPRDMREAHRNGLARYLVTGEGPVIGNRIEIDAMDASDRIFPIELAINVVDSGDGPEFVSYIRDISERRSAEQRVQDMARLPNENPAPVMRFDGRGELLYANEASGPLANHLNVSVGSRPTTAWQQKIYETLASSVPANMEIGVGDIQYSVLLSPIPEKQEVNLYGFDVSSLKRAEAELMLQRDRAEEANRAKSRFLAMMSHEIRTPLNAVLGVLGLLSDTELSSEQSRYVVTGRTSAEALLTVINDILDFSKMEAGKLELEISPFDPADLARVVVEVLSPRAVDRGIDLRLEAPSDLPTPLLGDPGRLRQVLLNFGSNAIRFTEQGSVTFRIGTVGGTESRPRLRFSVRDTGSGVPEDLRDHMFSEFSSSTGAGDAMGGTGLGLAICQRIVETIGGEIGFSTETGTGSDFWFEVELEKTATPVRPVEASPQDVAADMDRRRNVRLLVAEDNPANQLVIRVMLEKAGFRLDIAGNGEEAVRAVQRRSYEAVLMDVGMPVMDGLSATAAIRALPGERADVPIVAMTAHVLDSEKSNILASGMDDFIAKPIDRQHLIRTIDRWVFRDQGTEAVAAPAATGIGDPVLDIDVIERLAEETSEAVVPEIARVFSEHLEGAIPEFETALDEKDVVALDSVAHRIGSSCGSLGAMRLFRTCRAIEAAVANGDDDSALAMARGIRQLAEASVSELREYVRTRFGT